MLLKPLTEQQSQILHTDLNFCIMKLQDLISKYEDYQDELDTYQGNNYYMEQLYTVNLLTKIHLKALSKRKKEL